MTIKITLLASAFALAAGAALAGDADFAGLDADKSGALSLAEINAKMAAFTAQDFAAIDADQSGDVSKAEYDAWKSVKPTSDPSQPQ
ncbi:MAG: hypothetical protein U5J99_11680 [Parvularculaceae bacterium]|nr:hypothetical protein [Parvularculaceae bacterium]